MSKEEVATTANDAAKIAKKIGFRSSPRWSASSPEQVRRWCVVLN